MKRYGSISNASEKRFCRRHHDLPFDPMGSFFTFNPKYALDITPSAPIIGDMGDPSKASTNPKGAPTFWPDTPANRASAHLAQTLLQNLGSRYDSLKSGNFINSFRFSGAFLPLFKYSINLSHSSLLSSRGSSKVFRGPSKSSNTFKVSLGSSIFFSQYTNNPGRSPVSAADSLQRNSPPVPGEPRCGRRGSGP